MKRYAILLATDKYLAYGPTLSCHNDARLMKSTLIDYCDFEEENIVIELLAPDQELAPEDLLSKIRVLGENSQDGDTLLFFYAGHGGVQEQEPYLVLPNSKRTAIGSLDVSTALSLRAVSEALRSPRRGNVRILDACQSGYDVRDPDAGLDTRGFTRAVLEERPEGWVTLAACGPEESSHSDSTLNNGVFTHALCEAIQEFKDGEEILPELLKIAACRGVAKWCEQSNHVQTPTLNASLQGNVVMAIRRSKTQIPTDRVLSEVAPSEASSLTSRLARLRGLIHIGSPEHLEYLQSYIDKIHSVVEANAASIDTFGCAITVFPVLSIGVNYTRDNAFPFDFNKKVARFVEAQRLQTLHSIHTVERRPKGAAALMNSLFDSTVEYSYHANQPSHWPGSYTGMEIGTDNYLPGALLFFYLLPLQTRICLLSGMAIQGEVGRTSYSLNGNGLTYGFYDLGQTDILALLEARVTQEMSKFSQAFQKNVEARLEYIEREQRHQ